jgi:hypothetical protein
VGTSVAIKKRRPAITAGDEVLLVQNPFVPGTAQYMMAKSMIEHRLPLHVDKVFGSANRKWPHVKVRQFDIDLSLSYFVKATEFSDNLMQAISDNLARMLKTARKRKDFKNKRASLRTVKKTDIAKLPVGKIDMKKWMNENPGKSYPSFSSGNCGFLWESQKPLPDFYRRAVLKGEGHFCMTELPYTYRFKDGPAPKKDEIARSITKRIQKQQTIPFMEGWRYNNARPNMMKRFFNGTGRMVTRVWELFLKDIDLRKN